MSARRRRWLAAVALPLLAAGCGQSADDSSVAQDLQASVAEIRAFAVAREPAYVEAMLDDLRADVDALLQRGAIDRGRAAAIVAAADEVGAQLALITPTTTTTAPPTTAAPPPHDEPAEGKGNGNGRGKPEEEDD